MQFKQAVNETASNFLLLGLKMKFFCSLTPKNLRNHLSWELSWTPSQKVFLNDAWTPSFQRTLLASKRFTIVHCRLRNMDHPSLIMLHWSNLNWYRCIRNTVKIINIFLGIFNRPVFLTDAESPAFRPNLQLASRASKIYSWTPVNNFLNKYIIIKKRRCKRKHIFSLLLPGN